LEGLGQLGQRRWLANQDDSTNGGRKRDWDTQGGVKLLMGWVSLRLIVGIGNVGCDLWKGFGKFGPQWVVEFDGEMGDAPQKVRSQNKHQNCYE